MGEREGGRRNPATTILALRRTTGDELRRRPGWGASWEDPPAAMAEVPPESPPKESDVGAESISPPFLSVLDLSLALELKPSQASSATQSRAGLHSGPFATRMQKKFYQDTSTPVL